MTCCAGARTVWRSAPMAISATLPRQRYCSSAVPYRRHAGRNDLRHAEPAACASIHYTTDGCHQYRRGQRRLRSWGTRCARYQRAIQLSHRGRSGQRKQSYIPDGGNEVVWMVSATTGNSNIVAGTLGSWGESGDSGPATSALLSGPSCVAVDSLGNLYVVEPASGRIRMVPWPPMRSSTLSQSPWMESE